MLSAAPALYIRSQATISIRLFLKILLFLLLVPRHPIKFLTHDANAPQDMTRKHNSKKHIDAAHSGTLDIGSRVGRGKVGEGVQRFGKHMNPGVVRFYSISLFRCISDAIYVALSLYSSPYKLLATSWRLFLGFVDFVAPIGPPTRAPPSLFPPPCFLLTLFSAFVPLFVSQPLLPPSTGSSLLLSLRSRVLQFSPIWDTVAFGSARQRKSWEPERNCKTMR